MKVTFIGRLILTPVPSTELFHVLQSAHEPFHAIVRMDDRAVETVTPPDEYETDLGSIPHFLRVDPSLAPTRYSRSYVLHDVCCNRGCFDAGGRITRRISDHILFSALSADGAPWWTRVRVFAGVRLFSWLSGQDDIRKHSVYRVVTPCDRRAGEGARC